MSDRRVYVQLPSGPRYFLTVQEATRWAEANGKSWVGVRIGHEQLVLQQRLRPATRTAGPGPEWVVADVRLLLCRAERDSLGDRLMFILGYIGGGLGAWLGSARGVIVVGVLGAVVVAVVDLFRRSRRR